MCESYFDDDDREVRFTVPYDALGDFELTDATEPAFGALAAAESVPAACRAQRAVSVRQQPQVQEVPSGD